MIPNDERVSLPSRANRPQERRRADFLPTIEERVVGRDGRAGLLVHVPGPRAYFEELIQSVPDGNRYWDPRAAAWWVDLEEELHVLDILIRRFGTLLVWDGVANGMSRVGREGATTTMTQVR